MLSELAAGAAIPGVMGVGPGKTYDAVVAAHAPELTGDAVTFVGRDRGRHAGRQRGRAGRFARVGRGRARADGLTAVSRRGGRTDGDTWTAVAESVGIVEFRGFGGDEADLSVVDGERTLTVDGEPTTGSVPALDALAEEHDSVALHAERVDGELFAVDVFPL